MSIRPVVAGNWKMHHGPAAARAFFRRFRPDVDDGGPRLLIFPPSLSLAAALEARPELPFVALGVQNVHWEKEGAFTGELSAPMAAEAGAEYVLVGHSERRHVFGETDGDVARKVKACLAAGLAPVVCVGETLAERREGRVDEVIVRQLDAALAALRESGKPPEGVMVAYEPVWAIGTGETATPDDASAAHGTLRECLSREGLDEIPILYGGSVRPHNAGELLKAPDVNGVLVGGASLDPESFAAIAEAAPGGS